MSLRECPKCWRIPEQCGCDNNNHDDYSLVKQELEDYKSAYNTLRAALSLVATSKRADGTYNRCREACEKLAKDALSEAENILNW